MRSRNQFRMLKCRMAGVQAVIARSDHHFSRHIHDQFGIGVIESGAQKSASGRGPVEAGPGDVITVNPGEVHDGMPIGDEGRFWQMLYFDPDVVAGVVTDIRQGKPGQFEFADPVMSGSPSAAVIRQLLAVATRSETGAELRTEELLFDIFSQVIRETAEPKVAPVGIKAVRQKIDDDPATSVSLAELSALTGLSRFQFLRAFDKATGLTPHAYLVQRRIQRARRLIATGSGLAEAALGSGFADQSHMTRVFTRAYGISPNAYAQALR